MTVPIWRASLFTFLVCFGTKRSRLDGIERLIVRFSCTLFDMWSALKDRSPFFSKLQTLRFHLEKCPHIFIKSVKRLDIIQAVSILKPFSQVTRLLTWTAGTHLIVIKDLMSFLWDVQTYHRMKSCWIIKINLCLGAFTKEFTAESLSPSFTLAFLVNFVWLP